MAQQTEAKKKKICIHTQHTYIQKENCMNYTRKKKKIYRLSFDQQCDILALGKKKMLENQKTRREKLKKE